MRRKRAAISAALGVRLRMARCVWSAHQGVHRILYREHVFRVPLAEQESMANAQNVLRVGQLTKLE